MKNKKRISSLSVEEKIELLNKIKIAREKGLSYTDIVKMLDQIFDVKISKATVIRWFNGKNKPAGYSFLNLNPSRELSYFLGALIGDGNVRRIIHDYKYQIRLRVKDYDFAQTFADCASKILGKEVRIKEENDLTRCGKRFVVDICNKRLWEFLTSRSLRQLMEIGRYFPSDFLRGLFDAEGSASSSTITFSNTNLYLIREVKRLLKSLGIDSRIRLMIRKGQKVKIRNKFYRANKNVYEVLISKKGNREIFARRVGFSIRRKSVKLK